MDDADIDPRSVAAQVARTVSPDGTACVVCHRGLAVRSVADLVQAAVLFERLGVNVLDMGRPIPVTGTMMSVAAGGLPGDHFFLPFESTV